MICNQQLFCFGLVILSISSPTIGHSWDVVSQPESLSYQAVGPTQRGWHPLSLQMPEPLRALKAKR